MSEVNGERGPGSLVRDPRSAIRAGEGRQEDVLADVDRELRAALSVSPSADFELRVLQRVAADGPVRFGVFGAGRRYGLGWGLQTPALLAAAASMVIVAGLFYALTRTPAIQPAPALEIAEQRPPVVEPPTSAVPRAKEVTPPAVDVAPTRVDVPRGRPTPEVIVPLNQMEAVRRLVRAVNEGRIAAPPEPSDGPMVPPAEIVVQPLVVDPIPLPALEPGAATPQANPGA